MQMLVIVVGFGKLNFFTFIEAFVIKVVGRVILLKCLLDERALITDCGQVKNLKVLLSELVISALKLMEVMYDLLRMR